ncbi:hypothetical protein HY212_03180 [Candidatus Pacearchaeota archaeon]|nr:hypothetical protein [Candidatus Pacearchaeota archaeon]
MTQQNALEIKEKILSILRRNGPSLPVHVASGTGLSILFSGAFLSELYSDKKIKISNMKVGSSPIYYLPEHEPSLEKYSQHLKSKEKDAFILLRDRRFLKDTEQDPAIRVALRAIKDFAVPFEKNRELHWRYFTIPESDFVLEESKIIKKPQKEGVEIKHIVEVTPKPKEEKEVIKTLSEEPKILNIFEKKPKRTKPKSQKKPIKKSSKKEEGFFNKVKELLAKKSIEILDIVDIKNGEITLKVKNKEKEELLIAYNKKKISDLDILKSYKKSQEANLPYIILSLGDAPKKTQSIINAAKNLSSIEKL